MNNFQKSNILHLINGVIKNNPNLKNNKLIFTTSTGIIAGEMLSNDEVRELEKNLSNETFVIYISNQAIESYNELEVKEKIESSDYIFLKNVTISNAGYSTKFQSYMLYVDSITGFSIGNL